MIFVLCLCQSMAWAQAFEADFTPTDTPETIDLFPSSFAGAGGVPQDFHLPSNKTLALEFGSGLVEVRAAYWEKRREGGLPFGSPEVSGAAQGGPYFDLLAKSSPFDGILVGESELAYSGLGVSSSLPEHYPIMSRFGLTGRWGKAGYGALYRSVGAGFVSLAGAKAEHDRDESQLWGEYDFGLFRLRGAARETWEQNSATHDLTLTKTATTSFHLARRNWSTSLSSSYSWIGRGETPRHKTVAFANGLVLAYRFANPFTVEPNVSFRQEWDPATGRKTDTPSAGLTLAYAPYRELQMIGRASYARDLSEDPRGDASIMNSTAGLNWKLGKSHFGEPSLSIHLEYIIESRHALADSQQNRFAGAVQFKIAGF